MLAEQSTNSSVQFYNADNMRWIRHAETDLPTVILDGAQAETCCMIICNYCNGLRLENPHATAFSMRFNQRLHSERRFDAITRICVHAVMIVH